MTLIKNYIFRIAVVLLAAVNFTSCDTDVNTLGTGIVSGGTFSTNHQTYPVTVYNKPLGAVQTNLLPAYLLGFNNDPLYGSNTASIVSQMTPSNVAPSFGDDVVMDSVVLTLPYFSRLTETLEDGSSLYVLDSVSGSDPIKISIYRNNFYLKDFDPSSDFDELMSYYSDRTLSSGEVIDVSLLEGDLLHTIDEFVPSSEQIVLYSLDEDTNEMVVSQRIAPALRAKFDLSNGYWEEFLFANEDQPELSNISNFQDFFRGLYIKAEVIDSDTGNMVLFDLNNSGANITMYYNYDIVATVDGEEVVNNFKGSYVMSFTGNKVNFYDTDFSNILEGDPNGDPQLFLKGGPGSMAVVNLFNGDDEGNSAILESFKANNWLINEAQLIFSVDQTSILGEEPDRVILYNLETGVPVIDYFIDQSLGTFDLDTKNYHLVPLVREGGITDGAGQTYKVRITEHINNLFERDSTNVKLGLVVTSNVSSANVAKVTNSVDRDRFTLSGSILSQKGTVLVGSTNSDSTKNVRFEIYYTEPNN